MWPWLLTCFRTFVDDSILCAIYTSTESEVLKSFVQEVLAHFLFHISWPRTLDIWPLDLGISVPLLRTSRHISNKFELYVTFRFSVKTILWQSLAWPLDFDLWLYDWNSTDSYTSHKKHFHDIYTSYDSSFSSLWAQMVHEDEKRHIDLVILTLTFDLLNV